MGASLDRQEFNITGSVYLMLYHHLTQRLRWMQRRSGGTSLKGYGTAIKPLSNSLYPLAARSRFGSTIVPAVMIAAFMLAGGGVSTASQGASNRQKRADVSGPDAPQAPKPVIPADCIQLNGVTIVAYPVSSQLHTLTS